LEKFFAAEDKFGRLAATLHPIANAARIGAAATDLAAGTLHEMPVHDAAATPHSFGDYVLLEEIAEGGMGGALQGAEIEPQQESGEGVFSELEHPK
jgi:hypothetical protein